MLQQTQVATVLKYYERWMKKWPSLQHLVNATEEEVAEMWSGLGYYSRGRRLLEGARRIVDTCGGRMPETKEQLVTLPGVGPYTASAIASIAYNEAVGVLDGNVMRILSRLCSIGAPVKGGKKDVQNIFWNLANSVVDSQRPGDFNQAMMDLGATVCTPSSPLCHQCPISVVCGAYKRVQDENKQQNQRVKRRKVVDIEECDLCLTSTDYIINDGVCNYPKKAPKPGPSCDTSLVLLISRPVGCSEQPAGSRELFMVKRPSGLLGGLWEFPCHLLSSDCCDKKLVISVLEEELGLAKSMSSKICRIHPDVVHKFSHIHRTYIIYSINVLTNAQPKCDWVAKWVEPSHISKLAISKAMMKVYSQWEANAGAKSTLDRYFKTSH